MDEHGKQRENEQWYRQLVELSPDPIVVHSEGKVVFVNRAAAMLTGAQSEAELIGQPVTRFIHPDSRERALERIQNALGTSNPVPLAAEEFLAADGTPYEVVSQPTTYGGKPAMHAIIRDISARKRTEGELQRLRMAVNQSSEVIFLTDLEGTITFVNPEFTRVYGYAADTVVGKVTPRILKSGKMAAADYELFWQTILGQKMVQGEHINKTKDGRFITVEGSANAVLDEHGAMVGFLAIQRDVTERKQWEDKLEELSITDALTGLYNRRYFEEEMARLERGRQFPVSIIMADLNGLKATNDHDGHGAGDALLRRAASVLTAVFRADEIVARVGGDEFAVLLPETDAALALQLVRRAQDALAEHNAANGGTPVSVAFGTSTALHGVPLAETLKEADARMYEEKRHR